MTIDVKNVSKYKSAIWTRSVANPKVAIDSGRIKSLRIGLMSRCSTVATSAAPMMTRSEGSMINALPNTLGVMVNTTACTNTNRNKPLIHSV